MPDITICTNSDCPIYNCCYRASCQPGEYRQSYARFEPQKKDKASKVECEMHMPMKQRNFEDC
jgi:hypothetical protein